MVLESPLREAPNSVSERVTKDSPVLLRDAPDLAPVEDRVSQFPPGIPEWPVDTPGPKVQVESEVQGYAATAAGVLQSHENARAVHADALNQLGAAAQRHQGEIDTLAQRATTRLAEAQLAAGDAGQAENTALRANSFARGNPYLEARNWRVIAEARRSAGDQAGARAAVDRVEQARLRQSGG